MRERKKLQRLYDNGPEGQDGFRPRQGMLEQIARRMEAGQLTPDQMRRVGKWHGKLSALLNATPEMLRRGPTESGAPGGSPAGPQAIQQRLADLQWLLSDMLTTPQ